MYKTFTKDMLENGMIVKTRIGVVYLVIDGYLIAEDHALELRYYNKNLLRTSRDEDNSDIVQVFDKAYKLSFVSFPVKTTLLWQRREEDIKEVTMAEIEEKFGCKVKIVNG